MEKVNWRRQGILLGIVLALALSVWVINWARTPELTLQSFPEDGRAVPSQNWQLHDCQFKSGAVAISGEEPYILFDGLSGSMQAILVRFGSELPPDIELRLYYPDDYGNILPERYEINTTSAGKTEYMFSFPLKGYGYLRLDVPVDYALSEVFVSESPLINKSHIISPFRFQDLALFFIVLLAIAETILYFWPKLSKRLLTLWRAKRPFCLGAAKALGAGAVLALLAWPVCHFRGITYIWNHVCFFMLAGVMCCGLWLLRGQATQKPQRVFALLCLGLGLIFLTAAPLIAVIPEDGGIHYRYALYTSYGGRAYVTRTDAYMMGIVGFPGYANLELNREFYELTEAHFISGARQVVEENLLSFPFPAYLPGALGLWLGRFLGMSFAWNYAFGRFVNLLAYTLIVCAAIKLAHRGKILLCVAGLVPSAVFQAATYSPGGLMMAAAMLATVALFRQDGKRGRAWALSKLGLVLVVMLTVFAAPSAVLTDGLGITTKDQLAYILSSPLAFIKTLVKFALRDLIKPGFLTELGNFSSYAISVPGSALILAALGITALTEPEDEPLGDTGSLPGKAAVAVCLCCAVGVLTVWVYVRLTPVGEGSVSGFQGRWLLPVLFPALYLLRVPKIRSTFHKGRYLYAMLCPAVLLSLMKMWMILRCYRVPELY